MNPNTKPSWLIICFPAALVGVLMFGYFRPTSKLIGLQRSAINLRASGGNRELVLASTRARRDELQTKLKTLEAERQTYVVRWQDLRKGFDPTNNRPDSLDKLTTVLIKNRLHVLSKQMLDGSGQRSGVWQQVEQRLKQPIESAFPELKPAAGAPATPSTLPATAGATPLGGDQRSIWEIHVAGSYDDVDRALREMVAVDPARPPLGREMDEPKPEFQLRRWKLTLAF